LGAALARSGLRARRDRRGGDWRHVALGRRGLDPRDGDRRLHHQHAHQRAAHSLGPAGVADRGDRRDRHHRGLSRHRSPAAAAVSGSKITELRALDVRFPTSRTLAGSDAMNTAPDYSATYVILSTDRGDGPAGHGLTFTIGRGTAVGAAAALALLKLLEPPKRCGEAEARRDGFPASTTSAGWLGYCDEELPAPCREAVNAGWTHVKMKFGRDIQDDVRRARIAREELGTGRR